MKVASEREFARERFKIVKARLEDSQAVIEPNERKQLQREYRLLGKLLDEAEEGGLLEALRAWRKHLGAKLKQHRDIHRAQQEAFDSWCRLPPDERELTPRPRPPSLGVKVEDKQGYTWVVDDRLLALLDDLMERLQRWLAAGDEDW